MKGLAASDNTTPSPVSGPGIVLTSQTGYWAFKGFKCLSSTSARFGFAQRRLAAGGGLAAGAGNGRDAGRSRRGRLFPARGLFGRGLYSRTLYGPRLDGRRFDGVLLAGRFLGGGNLERPVNGGRHL